MVLGVGSEVSPLAALLGPSLVLPVGEGKALLGTWQQVVLVDFDNRPRERSYSVTVMGEA